MHNGFHNTTVLIMAQLVGFNYVRKTKGPKMGAKYSHFKGGENSEGVGLDREKRAIERRQGLPTSSLRSHLRSTQLRTQQTIRIGERELEDKPCVPGSWLSDGWIEPGFNAARQEARIE